MRTKRRFLGALLATCMVFSLTPMTALATATSAGACPGGGACAHEAAVGSTHYDRLTDAVADANGSEIQLLRDVDLASPIIVDSDVTIDGSNGDDVFQITSSTTGGHHRQGLFHMANEGDAKATLTLKNIALVSKSWSNPCGVSIRASNQTLNLENAIIDASHYCVFVGVPGSESEDVNDVTVNIAHSKLTGYAAVYYRTNSTTNMIMRPVLNATDSELTGRGVNGFGNGFSTIVYNGTRDARASISGCTLSNSFDSTNEDANEGIIQFNPYGAYEERAEITISHSTLETKSTTAAPNAIKYTAGENLNVGNKVIVDDLTVLVDGNRSDLIRVVRGGNELVATGRELGDVLSLSVPSYGDKPGGSTSTKPVSLLAGGDVVLVPVDASLSSSAIIPENVTVVVSEGAALTALQGAALTGTAGAKLTVRGTVSGLAEIPGPGTYIWQGDSWVAEGKHQIEAPAVDLSTPVEEVTVGVELDDSVSAMLMESADEALKTAIQAAIAQGIDVVTSVEAKRISPADVPGDAAKAEAAAKEGGLTAAEYLDLRVLVTIGATDPREIAETRAELTFQVAVPENLKKEGRVFFVIRVHGGAADILAAAIDEETGLLTFQTDKFSTYVLAYKDSGATEPGSVAEPPAPATPSGPGEGKVSPQTGAGGAPSLPAALLLASGVALAGALPRRKKGRYEK